MFLFILFAGSIYNLLLGFFRVTLYDIPKLFLHYCLILIIVEQK